MLNFEVSNFTRMSLRLQGVGQIGASLAFAWCIIILGILSSLVLILRKYNLRLASSED